MANKNLYIGTKFILTGFPHAYIVLSIKLDGSIICKTSKYSENIYFSKQDLEVLEKFGYIDYLQSTTFL